MNFCILVARYNEDIRWIRWLDLPLVDKTIIVNKGADDIRMHHTFVNYRVMFMDTPNVGREGHTFYRFIVDNYDILPDYVILLQGNPFDHSPHVVDHVNQFLRDAEEYRPDFVYLSEEMIPVDLDGEGHFSPEPLPMRAVMEYIFQHPCDPTTNCRWMFGAGAQFAVSKAQILRRPRELYERVVHLLESSVDPIEGYCVERLHPIILNVMYV
jgi:hypothetical protein